MAINLDKYLKKSATVSSSKVNLDKYLTSTQKTSASKKVVLPTAKPAQKPQPANGTILTKAFPDFLGGGVYQIKVGDPSWKNDLGHTTYGGVETKPGYERADIFPVSLSGVNSDKRNITMEKNLPAFDAASFAKSKGQPYNPKDLEMRTATDKYLMEDILPKLKDGKITLREAQVKAVSYLRNEQEGLNKAMENQDAGGLFGSFADEFVGTANKIGTFLGKKTGEIANKVIGQKNVDKAFKAIAPKPKGNAMEFKVGAGLPEKQAEQAQQTVQNNINIAQKESASLPFDKRVANFIADKAKAGLPSYKKAEETRMKPFIEENKRIIEQNKANEPKTPDNPNMQFNIDNTAQGYKDRAKIASEILGREIKPENIVAEEKNFAPHIKLAIQAKNEEKTAEQFAQATTMPIRWTIGQLARDYAMTEDELKGSNEKFIPTKDWEKLIYGEEPIQALSQSEDLYGQVARNVGVAAAIGAMIFLDLDILNPNKLIAKALEEKVAKQGIDNVVKMGTDEYIKMIDDIIASEKAAGKITEDQVLEATLKAKKGVDEIKSGKSVEIVSESKTPKSSLLDNVIEKEKATKPPVKSKIVSSEAKTTKVAETAPKTKPAVKTLDSVNPTGSVFKKYTPEKRATAKLADNIVTLDKTMKKSPTDTIIIYRGAPKTQKSIVAGDFITTNKQLAKDYAGTGVVLEKKVRLKDILDDASEPLGEEYIYRPSEIKEQIENLKNEVYRFHETSQQILDKIKQDGLKVSPGQYGKGVYFAPEVGKQEASKTGAIIRVKKSELDNFDYSEFPEQGWTTKNVPSNILEFSTDKGKTWNKLVENAPFTKAKKSAEKTNLPNIDKGKKLRANSKGGDGSNKKVRVNKQTGKTEKKLTLPKKQKITYKPIEKPVDLRKKIKVERTIAEQSTPKRIQKDAIEKGLIDAYKDIPEYDKINLKEQAAGVAKLINNDYEAAKRIALGQEMPKNGLLPESVLIGVKNQALKDGDIDLLIQLATDENGVAKGTTLLGQRIKALDEGMEDDAFRNIRKVVENRKNNISRKSEKTAKKAREKAAKILKENKPNKYDWQNLVKEITCPTV